jgi:hypothetical protein
MAVFWNTTSYILAQIDRCFRGLYCLYRQGGEITRRYNLGVEVHT